MTSDNQLKRIKYQHGTVLGAADFTDEQEYFLRKQCRHNRYLHGWGVVSGMSVSVEFGEVLVDPGMAIDCAGNEIFLDSPRKCDLPIGWNTAYVVVEYSESDADLVPDLMPDGLNDASQIPTRILEGALVYVMDSDPALNHDGMEPGSPGCNRKHPVPIAHVAIDQNEIEVSPCGRR